MGRSPARPSKLRSESVNHCRIRWRVADLATVPLRLCVAALSRFGSDCAPSRLRRVYLLVDNFNHSEYEVSIMGAATFISYSSQDREIALTVCEALENRGVSCWISCRDIGPGENFQVSIVRAIRAAKVMVLVFSANCNNSEEIKKELVLAGRSQLIVIPVRVEDVAPDEAFAYELATRQWVDLFADWESSILRLSRQIGVLGCCTVRSDGEPSEIIKVSVEKTATACAEERAAPFQTKLGRAAQACLRSGALRYLTSMAVLALVGIASTAAWYWHEAPPIQSTGLPPPRQSAPVSLADVLAARFISAVPSLDQISRRDLAQAYQSAPGHKAQAVSLQTAGMWRATSRSDAGIAREAALEECQVVFGNPCVLLAVDEDVTTPPADGRWKAQDMPRARYAGISTRGKYRGCLPKTATGASLSITAQRGVRRRQFICRRGAASSR